MHNKKFPSGCVRVAICMYGQYRTGDYLMPYFKKLFSSEKYPDVEFDFFCSAKVVRSFSNSPSEIISGTDTAKTAYTADELTRTLETCVLNPCAVNVITEEQDNQVNVTAAGWGPMWHGIADSLRLKSIYEMENDIEYDLMFLCRYDVMIHPVDHLMNVILNWYNNVTENEFHMSFSGEKLDKFIVSENMPTRASLAHKSLNGIQDLFVWGSGNCGDLLLNEIYRLLHHSNNSKYTELLYHDAHAHGYDGHIGFDEFIRRSRIGFCQNLPAVYKNNIDDEVRLRFPLCTRFDDEGESHADSDWNFKFGFHVSLVREFFDLSLDPLDPLTGFEHSASWVNDVERWNTATIVRQRREDEQ